nr:dipeptidase [uncultured Undibacterium sp.]
MFELLSCRIHRDPLLSNHFAPLSVRPLLLIVAFILTGFATTASSAATEPSAIAKKTASYAIAKYDKDIVKTLGKMVSFNTVANPDVPFEKNPAHIGFKKFLQSEAKRLGFDFTDYGYVVVIGYGKGEQRVGMITHGDVQPVDPTKWKQSPFILDSKSEPGKLLGRGTEDDKGPIASGLYAMKAIKDKKLALRKRIELYVYMAEESDWAPLEAFLKTHTPPQINITLDAEYPVVIAEKGYGTVQLTVPPQNPTIANMETYLSAFGGGFFGSQIPEDAYASISNATPAIEQAIKQRIAKQNKMQYSFSWKDRNLQIKARGISAHSSKPEDGVNAIAMLADALYFRTWQETTAGSMVNLINELLGTSLYGEKLGKAAYHDNFMGSMSVAPTVIKQTPEGIQLGINIRRPQGKESEQLQQEIQEALNAWQSKHVALQNVSIELSDPWIRKDAPQIPTLLSVFAHYTGIQNAKPISIGGGTNSRLFPNAVSFGPSMPGMVYSGHSEHEFISTKQLLLNLQMYTAVLVELAK